MSGKQNKRLVLKPSSAKLIYDPNLLKSLRDNLLILDASFIIDISHVKELRTLYEDVIRTAKCVPISIVPAMVECMSGADSVAELEQTRNFLTSLRIGFLDDMERYLVEPSGIDFGLILRRCKVNDPSYTDKMLMFMTQYFSTFDDSNRRVKLLTSNHNDIAHEIFTREGLITVDNDKEINNIGIYSLNKDKYRTMLDSLRPRSRHLDKSTSPLPNRGKSSKIK